ncbi:hypothetical protein [Candidatus Albibeggiatoa sp. nov. NOAA]|uniref:hypothetical protein n=1 Tax=Candidatus Albibeggiatoa sp. nov. NOAA TaxID=3162724 RepID=UPI0032FBF45F|nr:hypothetical protein [Thiotrichaceae bacterium]
MQKYLAVLLLLIWSCSLKAIDNYQITKTTPSDVYEKLYIINQEIKILKQFFHVTAQVKPSNITTELYPRHMWQKTYEVLVKINLLREKYGLPYIAVSSREPRKAPPPIIVYEQMLRILTEIKIIKYAFNIPNIEFPVQKFTNIKVVDSFNFISNISAELDLLLGKSLTPSFVFAQAMRISEDINAILDVLDITNDSIPPPKDTNTTPQESYETAQKLMTEVARLQRMTGVNGIEFKELRPEKITPGDVFSMTGILLAELQTIKAYLGLKHALTPVARRYTGIVPADVEQVLGWCVRKVQLIESIN